jgi:hydroxyethylthiazole kinase
MQIDKQSLWTDLQKIREQAPLVHNITNYVVMNSSANALLAIGASPVMAHAEDEVADMVSLAGALVINIGTLSRQWIVAMHAAMFRARELGKPIIIDPVGAGATQFRTRTSLDLITRTNPQVIRGNASEIKALIDSSAYTKGVDSTESARHVLDQAYRLAEHYKCVVVVSGATDYIVNSRQHITVKHGHPLMTKVTGLGCTATALIGAFMAVNRDAMQACAHAMTVMGIAGEKAAAIAQGPGTLQLHLLDALYNLAEDDFKKLHIKQYEQH